MTNIIIDKTLTNAPETSTVTNRDRNKLNSFERKVYTRILGPVYGKEKENWRILTNKKYMQLLKIYHNRDNKAT
jgi:thymidylate synthase